MCTHAQAHKNSDTNTHGGEKFARFSLIYLQHMFPICVKLLPECTITAEAFTSGEPNYLSDTTFPFSTCPWHLVRLHFPCTYRLKHTLWNHINVYQQASTQTNTHKFNKFHVLRLIILHIRCHIFSTYSSYSTICPLINKYCRLTGCTHPWQDHTVTTE